MTSGETPGDFPQVWSILSRNLDNQWVLYTIRQPYITDVWGIAKGTSARGASHKILNNYVVAGSLEMAHVESSIWRYLCDWNNTSIETFVSNLKFCNLQLLYGYGYFISVLLSCPLLWLELVVQYWVAKTTGRLWQQLSTLNQVWHKLGTTKQVEGSKVTCTAGGRSIMRNRGHWSKLKSPSLF